MEPEQRRFLRKKYDARSWPRIGLTAVQRKSLDLRDLEIPNAQLVKMKTRDAKKGSEVQTIWQIDGDPECLIKIDVFSCTSTDATHSHLLNLLGTIQSGDVIRDTDRTRIGDLAFSLHDTLHVFTRDNVVVLIRNAGRHVASVRRISERVDAFIRG
jgi:hypothetical protein